MTSCVRLLWQPTLSLITGNTIHNDILTGTTSFDQHLIVIFSALGVISFFLLLFIDAPFGRFSEQSRLPKIPGVVGWVIQEAPAFLVFSYVFITNFNTMMENHATRNILCAVMFLTHYFHRAFLFPLVRLHSVSLHSFYTVIFAFMFCTTNGYLNAKHLTYNTNVHGSTALYVVGFFLWALGFYLNYTTDQTLIDLRKNNKAPEKKYHIPYGGLFNYVSAANYTGEMVEWLGFAICVDTCAAWVFFFWTLANLIPRGMSVHRWYHEKFSNYKNLGRKAVIPFVL